MARMHSRRKGKSGSKRPTVKTTPSWVEMDKRECEKNVAEMASKGMTASRIGLTLRDQYGVPSVKTLTGKKVDEILRENKLSPKFPDDVMALIKRAVNLGKHLEKNKKDLINQRGLHNIESKIKRLTDYYKRKNIIAKDWYYNAEQAALLVK
jgi:small subunit ribosomal protein S15